MKNGMFEMSDCAPASFFEVDYKGKVLVLSHNDLKPEHRNERGQLWLATGGSGCEPCEPKGLLTAVRLSDGETAEWRRGRFYGAILPALLPDWARRKLGSIPASQRALEDYRYYGYIISPNETLQAEAPLADWQDALDYIAIQKQYQHRIDITDARTEYVMATVVGGTCRIDTDLLLRESREIVSNAHTSQKHISNADNSQVPIDAKTNMNEYACRLFATAKEFLQCAGMLSAQSNQSSTLYSMCHFAADRMLLAYLCEQGIPPYDLDYERRQTAMMWKKCKDISPRFEDLEQEFEFLLDCEWAGLPGEKTPDLRLALESAERLQGLVAELAPSICSGEHEQSAEMELRM